MPRRFAVLTVIGFFAMVFAVSPTVTSTARIQATAPVYADGLTCTLPLSINVDILAVLNSGAVAINDVNNLLSGDLTEISQSNINNVEQSFEHHIWVELDGWSDMAPMVKDGSAGIYYHNESTGNWDLIQLDSWQINPDKWGVHTSWFVPHLPYSYDSSRWQLRWQNGAEGMSCPLAGS